MCLLIYKDCNGNACVDTLQEAVIGWINKEEIAASKKESSCVLFL